MSGDAQDAAARREWRQNFASVLRGLAAGTGLPRALFQPALFRALTLCNYLLSVIFFNHRSPRRSAFTLTDLCRKDSAAPHRPNTLRYSPGGVEDKEDGSVRDGSTDTGQAKWREVPT